MSKECDYCSGKGFITCNRCRGKRLITKPQVSSAGMGRYSPDRTTFTQNILVTCPKCNGTGVIKCPKCKGKKIIKNKQK